MPVHAEPFLYSRKAATRELPRIRAGWSEWLVDGQSRCKVLKLKSSPPQTTSKTPWSVGSLECTALNMYAEPMSVDSRVAFVPKPPRGPLVFSSKNSKYRHRSLTLAFVRGRDASRRNTAVENARVEPWKGKEIGLKFITAIY